jgi:tRNA (Thr-GGU) A37 N-methylase
MQGVSSGLSQPWRPNNGGIRKISWMLQITENRLLIGPIEAIDGTPVIDIKPVIGQTDGL